MAKSILNESRKARLFGGKTRIFAAIVLLLAGGYYVYGYYAGSKETGRQRTVQKSATVTRGDIRMAVETEGTVVAEDGVELSFSTTGETVEKIYVKEGDMVKKGDKIASISTDSMQYELQNAKDSYNSALLALADGKAGAGEREIKNARYQIEQAEANLEQAKASLMQIKIDAEKKVKNAEEAITDAEEDIDTYDRDADTGVEDAYSSLYSDVENFSVSLKSNLYSADKILGVDEKELNDEFESVLGVLNTSSLYNARYEYQAVSADKKKLDSMLASSSKSDHNAMDTLAEQALATAEDAKKLFVALQGVLDATITSAEFTQGELDSMKSSVSSLRLSANASVSTFEKDIKAIETAEDTLADKEKSEEDAVKSLQKAYNDAVQNLEDVKRQNEIDIKNAEVSVRNKEIALDQANMSYEELMEPLTTSELQKLTTAVNQARNNLEEVQDKIEDATLVSPIDGTVGNINGKEGSLIPENSSESFVTIINKDTLFVQVNVEENDINSIEKGQKAYVTFDAVDGLVMEGEVSFISMTAESNNSGVVTYEVRVLLSDVGETEVREGMTAFVSFVTDEVKDVLQVPVAAVTNRNGTAAVKKADGAYAEVVTGFTDGKMVEIVSGLKEGDKIVY
jgi:HlyD family secretion protein